MINNKLIGGLICEFNPLHNGHKYILDKIKEECQYTVCVMSGNFVQRGDAAIIDKWNRAECALKLGADLVIELPVWNSVSTAEKFAFTGVHLLHSLGCVDKIYFGSECGDADKLKTAAKLTVDSEINALIRENKNDGATFAKVRENAVKKLYGEEISGLFKESNNILGIEYIKALNKLESNIEPLTIKRYKAGHNEGIVENFASATKIRELISTKEEVKSFVPDITNTFIENSDLADIKNIERAILCKLRSLSPTDLLNIPDVSEGLENRIIEGANENTDLNGLYLYIKTRRYSHARIRRIILSSFLNITKELPLEGKYLRILGMTKKGEEILKEKKNTLPYVLSYSDAKKNNLEKYFEFEARCDSIYELSKNTPNKGNGYFTHKLIKI
ncbi:MAG: nucleotidyltransferase family protein [Ruminococcaceae bacterium]|nr:nucleotidyltransferase family protein [Oscillospiraceae bacterium]